MRRFPEEGRIQARKGDSVTLRCLGEGNPPPSIRWSKPVSHRLTPLAGQTEILGINIVIRFASTFQFDYMMRQGHYFQNGDDKFQGSVLSFQAVGRQDVGLYGTYRESLESF